MGLFLFSHNIASAFHTLSPRAEREEGTDAPEQGGLLSGKDPTAVDFHDPIRIWIVQLGVIIGMATLLAFGLKRMRQPKVIAEVLGGIILGPTAFGQIPGFQEHIFPEPTLPFLSLTATIGLCLFLFLVGLEIDAGIIKRNARLSATVALGGMILPFGLGAALAVPMYNEFIDESVKFTNFMLFVGVAFSITAFPVLCRILTELKLLDTTVGIVVLSAGVGNDIIGWVLLALSVALVNAGSGLMALYILLVCVGFTFFLLFPGRWLLQWVAVKTGSIENGPTMIFMTITILFLFGSAFFTDIIGVHAIFGAFIAGIIVPREGHLNITLAEKLEDIVSIIFLPLYFTLSGLSTDLTLLDDGITWGFTIAICVLAFVGKFGGCFVAARYVAGFNSRESSTIGALMSCKGLVELIVLNVGLAAGILSQRVFSMFVLEALVLTFITTPLTTMLYPPHMRVRVGAGGAHQPRPSDDEAMGAEKKGPSASKKRFTVVLDKLEHVPGMMALTQLIQAPSNDSESTLATGSSESSSADGKKASPPSAMEGRLSIEALRLIELSDRTSAVMRSSAADTLASDPVLGIFRMFGELNDMPVTQSLAIVPYDDLSYSVAEHAKDHGSDMILVPWLPPHPAVSAHHDDQHPLTPNTARSHLVNPFDLLLKHHQAGSSMNIHETSASAIHSHFIRGVFSRAQVDVALFVDQAGSIGNVTLGSYQHLFIPFFGGPDDRLALEFVGQCCQNRRITATVVRIVKSDDEGSYSGEKVDDGNMLTVASVAAPGVMPDTVYGAATTETRMQSETADNIVWAKYTSPSPNDPMAVSSDVLSRMTFRDITSRTPLHSAILEAGNAAPEEETLRLRRRGGTARKIVVVGRSKRLAVENHAKELRELISEKEKEKVAGEVKRTIGDVGTAFVVGGSENGIVVVQAAALEG